MQQATLKHIRIMSGVFIVTSMLTVAAVLLISTLLAMRGSIHLSVVMFCVGGMLGIHFHWLRLLIIHKIDRATLAELPL